MHAMGVGGDLISRAAWMFARSNPETRSRRARYRRWSQNDSDVLASAIVADGMSTPKKLDHPFQLAVLGKVENLVEDMLAPKTGVPVRTIKQRLVSFNEVFHASDLIAWLMNRLAIRDKVEAVCLASAISSFGYVFPVDWNHLANEDGSLYRFQSRHFWPSHHYDPDNTDYAIYLAKRSLRSKGKHGLTDHETEVFQKLRKLLSARWDHVLEQARAQLRVLQSQRKKDRNVSDSQEKAFWRLHRPPPGQVRVMEFNKIKLAIQYPNDRRGRLFSAGKEEDEVQFYQRVLEKALCRVSRQCEGLIHHCKTYRDYDPMLSSCVPSNPWITDDTSMWDMELQHVSTRRASLWSLSFGELLSDDTGQQAFYKFCQKEFSSENIRFWQACQRFKQLPASSLHSEAKKIYEEYVSPKANEAVNINQQILAGVQEAMKKPTRYLFEHAENHIYHLMETDSYKRFLKSPELKQLLELHSSPANHPKKGFLSLPNFMGRATSPRPKSPRLSRKDVTSPSLSPSPSPSFHVGSLNSDDDSLTTPRRSRSIENLLSGADSFVAELCGGAAAKKPFPIVTNADKKSMRHSASAEHLMKMKGNCEMPDFLLERRQTLSRTMSDSTPNDERKTTALD
ncbi:regulator of G-protein signaling 6-like isoform X2 [Oscarella lobularis]|uniref:regulator of G-protein signaling 6-like isoform X2 n=1 Tax=Oscarella lobularis TaxID=121494 RepID=UPI0033134B3D